MNEHARVAWRRTSLHVWPESYALASLPRDAVHEAAGLLDPPDGFAHLLIDHDETSLTVERNRWEASSLVELARAVDGPFRVITFDVALDLDLCGYLAPAAERLAVAGIPIVPQCGYSRDHLLVPADRLGAAVRILLRMVAEA
jgi:hypothetical protein